MLLYLDAYKSKWHNWYLNHIVVIPFCLQDLNLIQTTFNPLINEQIDYKFKSDTNLLNILRISERNLINWVTSIYLWKNLNPFEYSREIEESNIIDKLLNK